MDDLSTGRMAYNWLMSPAGKIIIYCDGACSGNQFRSNIGGWGAVLKFNSHTREISGGEPNTSNQRMEITACIRALELLNSRVYPVEIFTDSAYLANCIQQKWYVRWQRNGWKNANKQPVENRELWERLLELLTPLKFTFFKVEGHSGNALNERADELAREAIERLRNAG